MLITLAILHTTSVTVEPLGRLARDVLGQIRVFNFVDDSVIPQLLANGADLTPVARRMVQYARFAEEVGSDVILSACSSVGPTVELMRKSVNIPVIRIDEAMAEQAVRSGRKIAVAATLETTLQPSIRLLEAKAKEAKADVEIVPVLAREAYECLFQGDKVGHDAVLSSILKEVAQAVDVIVLAQASMSRVVEQFPVAWRDKFLSSPQLCMEQVRQVIEELYR